MVAVLGCWRGLPPECSPYPDTATAAAAAGSGSPRPAPHPAAGGTGPFGTSEHFNTVIKPLCKVNEKGNPIMNIKTVPGANGLAQIELDFNALLCLALSIKPNDPYDFGILSVDPIPNTNNFSIVIMKVIASNGVRKGRTGQVNYARIEQDQYNRFNGGNRNNGSGRRF